MTFPRARRMLTWIAAIALLFYGGAVGWLYLTQRSLMYFPNSMHVLPAAAGLPAAEEVVLTTTDGERVIAWHVPPRGEQPVVLYFHGNGEIVAWRVERHRKIVADGTGL